LEEVDDSSIFGGCFLNVCNFVLSLIDTVLLNVI